MYNNLKLILSSFTRQSGPDGCGAACLQTIFNYSGLAKKLPDALSGQALTMQKLRDLSNEAGLEARAVRMEPEYLRGMQFPSILHVKTDSGTTHFVVHFCFDPDMELYLIGDPDGDVCYLTEAELLQRWESRAAIYFESLPPKRKWKVRLYPWDNLYHFNFVPGILWIAIPFLNTFGTLLGLGATLVIEKAVSPHIMNGGIAFLTMIFVLLVSISAGKCIISYVKERMIINFGGRLDAMLYGELTQSLERSVFNTRLLSRRFSETIKDVQRIHQAASILIGGILCDGILLLLMLGGLYIYFPALVMQEVLIAVVLFAMTDNQLPFMLVNYHSAQTAVFPNIDHLNEDTDAIQEKLRQYGADANAAFSRKASRLSINANKLNLYFDAVSSLNVILVLVFMIGELRSSAASYEEFIFGIIFCYAIVATVTKICNQMFLVAHGAEMLRHRPR